jgi:PAS domain S-box-containing protein/putative nucleotidyltransferase with HDIG domain
MNPLTSEGSSAASSQELRVLMLEDVPIHAHMVEDELRRAKIRFTLRCVSTRQDFVQALQDGPPDLILADYKLPTFDGLSALAIGKETCPDVPFILVSGEISEQMALQAVHGGATDYVFKDHLLRLVPSVHRALREVREREERRHAQEALRTSERRYRLLVEHSHDAILQLDRDGRVAFANPATRRIFQYAPEEFLADPTLIERLIQPRSRQAYDQVRQEVRERGVLTEDTAEWVWTRKDGQQVFTECVFTNLPDEEGEIYGFQLIIRDLSDQKRSAAQLQESYEKLRRILGQTVHSLASAVEMRDPYTGGHQHRVAQLAQGMAQRMGLPDDQVEGIHLTGLLHDIGKINIPAEILTKPGKLTDLEMMIIRTHSQAGHDILKAVEFPWPVAQTVLQHHERMDGSGYPQGLSRDAILLEARILGVADFVEAMASHRPYRPGHGVDRALLELMKQRGVHFDPAAVDACLAIFGDGRFKFQTADEAERWASAPVAAQEQ